MFDRRFVCAMIAVLLAGAVEQFGLHRQGTILLQIEVAGNLPGVRSGSGRANSPVSRPGQSRGNAGMVPRRIRKAPVR